MWDHPRSRGVYPNSEFVKAGNGGSSPLARGLLGHSHVAERDSGIIPARAGFTTPNMLNAIASWDHPRSRGVYPGAARPGDMVTGSSPLARGLRKITHYYDFSRRIIPARAGFTW